MSFVEELQSKGISVRLRDNAKNLGLAPPYRVEPMRSWIVEHKSELIEELKLHRKQSKLIPMVGPGTELTKLIPKVFKRKGCSCAKTAIQMNRGEVTPEQVVEWLVKRAKRYLIPEIASRRQASKWVNQAYENARYSVVWVYWAHRAEAKGEELRASMRLARKHLGDAANFVICGDRPEWYDGPFIESPRFSADDAIAEFGSKRFVKWIDSTVKLQRIIDSDLVTDNFLWMYDDTFIVKPTSIAMLSIARASGLVHAEDVNVKVRKTWREVRRRTAKALSDRGMTQHDFSTHYPMVYDKKRLTKTIAEFDTRNCARCIESLYGNQWLKPTSLDGELLYRHRVRGGFSFGDATVVNVGKYNDNAKAAIGPLVPQSAPWESDGQN